MYRFIQNDVFGPKIFTNNMEYIKYIKYIKFIISKFLYFLIKNVEVIIIYNYIL